MISEMERLRRIASFMEDDRATAHRTDLPLWHLSFYDPEWIGSTIVPGLNGVAAVTASHRLNCNPGGSVSFVGPFERETSDLQYIGRLFTTESECEAAGVVE